MKEKIERSTRDFIRKDMYNLSKTVHMFFLSFFLFAVYLSGQITANHLYPMVKQIYSDGLFQDDSASIHRAQRLTER